MTPFCLLSNFGNQHRFDRGGFSGDMVFLATVIKGNVRWWRRIIAHMKLLIIRTHLKVGWNKMGADFQCKNEGERMQVVENG